MKLTDRLLRLLSRRQSPVVLAYHGIDDDPGGHLDVSLAQFREHVGVLRELGWMAPTAHDALTLTGSAGTCAICFDDCYAGTLRAADVLEANGFRGTWFAVSSAVAGKVTWEQNRASSMRTLRIAELRQLQRAGMEIGSHSVSHRRMSSLDAHQLHFEAYYSRVKR